MVDFVEPVVYFFILIKGFYLEFHRIYHRYPHVPHEKWGMTKCYRLLWTELCEKIKNCKKISFCCFSHPVYSTLYSNPSRLYIDNYRNRGTKTNCLSP